MYRKEKLKDEEKILLSRVYKLDRQIQVYIKHHKNESMNKLLPQTDFIKKANLLYDEMSDKLIKVSVKNAKYFYNLVNMNKNSFN